MNFKSYLFALNNFLVFGVFLPTGMVFLNNYYGLLVIQNPIFKTIGLAIILTAFIIVSTLLRFLAPNGGITPWNQISC